MEKFFKMQERGSSAGQELRAGLTTFLAMAYIIAVNPPLLEAAGIAPAAAVTVQGGAVTDLSLCLRGYTAGSTASAVLPVTQAAAAVSAGEGEGGELLLCYRDLGGSSVSAGWAVTD